MMAHSGRERTKPASRTSFRVWVCRCSLRAMFGGGGRSNLKAGLPVLGAILVALWVTSAWAQDEAAELIEDAPLTESQPGDDGQPGGNPSDEGEATNTHEQEAVAEENADLTDDGTDDDSPRNYPEEDLEAQNRMAFATEELVVPTVQMATAAWWQAVVTAVGTVLLLLTLFASTMATKAAGRAADAAAAMVKQGEAATKATLIAADAAVEANKAAIEANRLQREAFVAEQRAWLVIESSVVTSDLVWDREKKRGAFSVRTTIMNRGKTPAVDVRVKTKSDARGKSSEDVYREVALEAAKTYRSVSTKERMILGNTVFPGGGIIFDSDVTITDDDFAAICATHEVDFDFWNKPAGVSVIVCFCVGYELTYADKRHRTGCILRLDVLPDKDGNFASIGPYFGNIPKSRLRLVPDHINSMRAD